MLTIVRDDKGNPTRIELSPYQGTTRKTFDQLNLVVNQIKPLNVVKLFTEAVCFDYVCRQIEEVEEAYASSLNQNTKEVQRGDETVTVLDLENPPETVNEMEEKYPHLKEFRETGEYSYLPEAKLPDDESFRTQLNSILVKYCKLWAKKKIAAIVLNKPENEISQDDVERAIIKQINYQNDGSELVLKKANGETLTAEEEEYLNQLLDGKQRIDQVRDMSNQVEDAILAAQTLDELLAVLSSLG